MKVSLVFALLCLFGYARSQFYGQAAAGAGGALGTPLAGVRPPLGVLTPAQIFAVELHSEAEKIFMRPELSTELMQRIGQIITKGQQGYMACVTAAAAAPKSQKRCASIQLKISKSELKALEYEALAQDQANMLAAMLQAANKTAPAGTQPFQWN